MGDSELSRLLFNQDSDSVEIPKIRKREIKVDDFGADSADIILEPLETDLLNRESRLMIELGTVIVLVLLVKKVSNIAATILAVVALFAIYTIESRPGKIKSTTRTIESEKMMIRVLISRYGKNAFYLYRDIGLVRSFFRTTMYANETVDPYIKESITAFGKMMYYVLMLEKGYAGDTKELVYELDLLKREGFNALAGHEFSADPDTVYADDKTIRQLIEDIKPRVQQIMSHAQTLISSLELSRIAKRGINTKSNLTVLGPWYSYRPADMLEESGIYS